MSVNRINPDDYIAKRFGLKYAPPSIILEYLVPSTGKLYHHKMKLRTFNADSSVSGAIQQLQKSHSQYFANNKITYAQIEKLVMKIKSTLKGQTYIPSQAQASTRPSTATSVQKENDSSKYQQSRPTSSYSTSPFENNGTATNQNFSKQSKPEVPITSTYNKPNQTQQIPTTSTKSPVKSTYTPSAPVVQAQLKTTQNGSTYKTQSTPAPKQEEKNPFEMSFSEDEDDSMPALPVKPAVEVAGQKKVVAPTPPAKVTQPAQKQNNYDFEDFSEDEKPSLPAESIQDYEEEYEEDFEQSSSQVDYHKEDLNQLDKVELDKHKAFMDVNFKKNQKKPGDSGYEYDKRESFKQNESNDWDDDL